MYIFLYIAGNNQDVEMKYFIYFCLSIFFFMACGEKSQDVLGYWNMEFDGEENSYSIVLPDDSICTSELCFKIDTIYIEVKRDNQVVRKEFLAKYVLKENVILLTDRYGKTKECLFKIDDNTMEVREKSEPGKIFMRLRRTIK